MSIEYTYEIISVDEAARCMEVVYTSVGRATIHVSARLPYEGETLEGVIDMYSPVRYWEEQELPVVVPQVGQTGTITPPEPAPMLPIEPPQPAGTIPQAIL